MTTLMVAHGGAGGLLVESLLLIVPVLILGMFILTVRKHGKQEDPRHGDDEVGR